MAEKEEVVGENTTRGSDWEVVSLTASAYAASPGPKEVDLKDDDKEVYEAETSHPLYMSRHFVFPQTDVATEPSELTEICQGKASKKMDSGFSVEQETGSQGKEDGDLTLKGLNLSDEFTGLEFFEEKGKREENIYQTAMSSLHDERAFGGSHVYEQNQPIHEPTEPLTPCDVSPDPNPTKDDKREVANVPPCEAWWKRSAASLMSQVKETSTVWSIFIAAAVMGIVILGQHWQQERWQILQRKWDSSIGNEKAGRLIGPISRLKQAFVGGQRRDSFIRVSSQNDS
uniref:ATG8-interacting protein 1 n=1 Tax=Noccaea caerulescens TaxID=107243 RepID=A0A1J3IRA4_NOCCA